MRKLLLLVVFGALSLVLWTTTTSATNIEASDVVTVPKGQVVDSSFYGAGSTITIAGTVKGDVYCAGQTIRISGTVEGDVLCSGQEVRITGNVQGDIRAAGQIVSLSGKTQSATLLGQSVAVEEAATVARDLTVSGQNITIDGKVQRDMVAAASSVVMSGVVGRDVTAGVETLQLQSGAKIARNLTYTSENKVSVDSSASVMGLTTQKQLPREDEAAESNEGSIIGGFFAMAAIFITGLIIWLLAPRWLRETAETMCTKTPATLGLGFGVLILTPVATVILILTLVGAPFGLFLGTLWLFSLFGSMVFAAYASGLWTMRYFKKVGSGYEVLGLLIFSILTVVLVSIPWIGGWIALFLLLWGLGGITFGIYHTLRRQQVKARPTRAK